MKESREEKNRQALQCCRGAAYLDPRDFPATLLPRRYDCRPSLRSALPSVPRK
jgi:hypothetical protein